MPTYMDTLQYPLNLEGWQGSQVIEYAKALAGTVKTASLNLKAVEIGSVVVIRDIFTCFCKFSLSG